MKKNLPKSSAIVFHTLQKTFRAYFIGIILTLGLSTQMKAQIMDAFVLQKDGAGLCPGGQIRVFIAPNANYIKYYWEILRPSGWSGVAVSGVSGPSLSHNEALPYRLRVEDVNGITYYSQQLNVVLLTPPPSIITPSPNVTQICQGEDVKLEANPILTAFYKWEYNNTILPENGLSITARKAGTYKLSVTDQNSCTTVSTPYTLSYFSSLVVQLNTVPTICDVNASPLNLQGSPAGGEYRGVGVTDKVLGTFSPSVAGVGDHEIEYAVRNSGTCPEIVEKINIKISEPKAIINNSLNRTDLCNGESVLLSGTTGFAAYEWFLNGSSINTMKDLTVSATGDYSLKVTDAENCSNTSAPVRIKFFTASATSMDAVASVCGTNYSPITLNGAPSGGIFTIDNLPATVFDYKKLGFGKHVINYKVNGVLTCLNGESSQEVYISPYPKIDLGNDIFLGKGNAVTLKGYIGNDYTYRWSPSNDLDNPNIANPLASPMQTSEYILSVTSDRGCESKDTIKINVYDKVYVPTAFSPNGDGQNDLWELSGINNYPDAEIQVFDRWGSIVFYSKGNYLPFDGTNAGNPLKEGTYIYKIYLYPNHPIFQYNGTLTILR